MGRLDGKVAVITGGNSGVGAATAKLFAKEGATVVITARREAALKEVADEITAAGGEVYAVSTDISKPEDPEALMQKVMDKYGKIDILVNNAGILEQGLKPIDRFLDEDMDRIIETNEKGTMRCMKADSKRMKSGASIVNVASVAGEKVVIVDDLIATGGTTEAIIKLIEQLGGEVVKIIFLIELEGLKGREKLSGYDVDAVIKYAGK